MRLFGRAALVGAAVAALMFSVVSPAAASTNAGWIYTYANGATSGNGLSLSGAFFDGDLNGRPGWEKITVCDNEADGRGVRAYALPVPPAIEITVSIIQGRALLLACGQPLFGGAASPRRGVRIRRHQDIQLQPSHLVCLT
jgi:hypothetical protein